MSAEKELNPSRVVLALGESKGRTLTSEPPVPVFGAIQINRESRQAPLFGVIQNKGAEVVTFSVEESDNDDTADMGDLGAADPYAVINIRVAEAAVGSVDVQPGGRVVFSIEPSEVAKDFLRFKAASAGGVAGIRHGYMMLCTWYGTIDEFDTRAGA